MAAGITQVDSSGSETESLFEDWGSHTSGNEEVSIQVDDTPLEVQEVCNNTSSESGVGRVGWCQFEWGVLQEAVVDEKRSQLFERTLQ